MNGRFINPIRSKLIKPRQSLTHLLVLDFEATCDKNRPLVPAEIIEFPCVVLTTKDWSVHDVFHEYVKPKVHPELTSFCTELTGIVQDMVDTQPHFPEVLTQFNEWVEIGKYFSRESKSAFVTCGNWDLKTMLPTQCAIDNIPVPKHFKEWIDLKHVFCNVMGYYPRSLTDMLTRLNIPLQGRLHSGLNDVENMINIIKMLKKFPNGIFKITSSLEPQIQFRKTQKE